MLAARSAINAAPSEKWVNPYITDGLVAMWDGEWNLRGGVHDANSTIWKDLVGGHKLTLDNGGSWGTNCLMCSGTARAAYGDNMTGAAPVVVEAVFKMNNMEGKWKTIWHQGGWYSGIKPTRCIIAFYDDVLFAVNGQYDFLTLNPTSIHIDYEGNYFVALKCNMQNIAINQFTTSWFVQDAGNLIAIGGAKSNANTYAANLDFYSLRLYSRTLTYEEIAHNYLVDKERFSIE